MTDKQLANPKPPTWPSTPETNRFEAQLRPATAKAGTAELMACLTLVAPSGMTSEDRQAWVAVARQTLAGIPADLLERGCHKARRTCRFASEIVPTILGEVEGAWRWRQQRLCEERWREENKNAPRLERPTHRMIPREETQRIIREAFSSIGDLTANIEPRGS